MPIDIYENDSIGDIIRKIREKGAIGKFPPLSQIDLALEVGWENPSTLSRIESGRVIPSRSTLIRICKALQLGNYEIDFLLSKLGYVSYYPKINLKYIRRMVNLCKKEFSSFPFPTMVEYTRRFIYINDSANNFFFKTNSSLKSAIVNKTYLEIIFLPEYGFRKRIVNFEEFAKFVTLNSNLLMPTMFVDSGIDAIDSETKAKIFNEMAKLIGDTKLQNIKYNIPLVYDHPVIGNISLIVSQFPLHFDDRFYVMQLIPSSIENLRKFLNIN